MCGNRIQNSVLSACNGSFQKYDRRIASVEFSVGTNNKNYIWGMLYRQGFSLFSIAIVLVDVTCKCC